MNLYIVTDNDRWGYSINLVRAESPEAAKQAVCPRSKRFEVEELKDDGSPKLLWCYDESPDTPRECDCD